MNRILLILVICLLTFKLLAQYPTEIQSKVDSLKELITELENDTSKISALIAIDNLIYPFDPEYDEKLNQQVNSMCYEKLKQNLTKEEKDFYTLYRISTLNNLGSIYRFTGDYSLGFTYLDSTEKLAREAGDELMVVRAQIIKGGIRQAEANYIEAIQLYTEALKLAEANHNDELIANILNSIGQIYGDQKNYKESIEYFRKSKQVEDKRNNQRGVAAAHNNMALVFKDQGDDALKEQDSIRFKVFYDSAITNYSKAYSIIKNENDPIALASTINNLGAIYVDIGDIKNARNMLFESIAIYRKFQNPNGIALCAGDLAKLHLKLNALDSALYYGKLSFDISVDLGADYTTKNASHILWMTYKAMGDYHNALKMHEKYIALRDFIQGDENQRALLRQEYQYQYDKQSAQDSIKNIEQKKISQAKLDAEKAKNEKQKQQSYFLYGGLVLALMFGAFIFNRFRITRKQRDIINSQKEKVEEQKTRIDAAYDELSEKNKEILDSINYAKRIQTAILPSNELVSELLPKSFIVYLPKDIVAGDFYWLNTVKTKSSKDGIVENLILFAAADCTGHGVPGAMVSVVCNNSLNRSVREFDLREPGSVLDKTRELVIAEFEKSKEDVKDGMDIALCSLTFAQREIQSGSGSDKSTELDAKVHSVSDSHALLRYAGAHNPLWILRKGSNEIEEIKADKQPIGNFDNATSFTTHVIDLCEGDRIFIFSDGYADQFGGPKGKKLKLTNFKHIILESANQDIVSQGGFIESSFIKWKGDYEQLDDVCVIGVEI